MARRTRFGGATTSYVRSSQRRRHVAAYGRQSSNVQDVRTGVAAGNQRPAVGVFNYMRTEDWVHQQERGGYVGRQGGGGGYARGYRGHSRWIKPPKGPYGKILPAKGKSFIPLLKGALKYGQSVWDDWITGVINFPELIDDWMYLPPVLAPAMGGWTRCAQPTQTCSNTWPPTHQQVIPGNNICTAHGTCPTSQVVSANQPVLGAPVATSAGQIRLWDITNASGSPWVGTISSLWRRPVPGNTVSPYFRPVVPIGAIFPKPSLMEKTLGQDDPSPDRLKPYQVEATDFTIGPRPRVVVSKGIHNNLKDPPGTRKKPKIPRSAAGNLYGGLTEIGDVLDCAMRSMKPRTDGHRVVTPGGGGRAVGLHEKMIFVLAHVRDIDWQAFASCVVQNEFSDQLIGRANRFASRVVSSNPYYGNRPVGIGFGGFSQRMR